VDLDRVEQSNLSRTVLFDESQLGRWKAEVAAQALLRLNPEVSVRVRWATCCTMSGCGSTATVIW
jgi:molybdopterin/thiamine biosynthesis adenylyltransferase